VVQGARWPMPVKEPHLGVIGDRMYLRGVVAFDGQYWLNGTVASFPLDKVTAVFSYPSEQDYVLAVQKHRESEKAKKLAEGKSEGPA